jgi:hypothetical protein
LLTKCFCFFLISTKIFFFWISGHTTNPFWCEWDGRKNFCKEKSFYFIKIVFLLLSLCLVLISYPYFHPYISQSCCTHRLFVILVYTGVLKCVCVYVCVCVRVCKRQSVCLPICACVWMKRVWVWERVCVCVCEEGVSALKWVWGRGHDHSLWPRRRLFRVLTLTSYSENWLMRYFRTNRIW